MSVKRQEVEKMASLARLNFSDAELDEFIPRFAEIIDFVAELKSVETADVEPLYHAMPLDEDGGSADRADEIRPSLTPEEALEAAPDVVDQQFRVPKVID